MPSSISFSAVRSISPLCMSGQLRTNLPASNRFAQTAQPMPSKHIIFSCVPRRFAKTNKCPEELHALLQTVIARLMKMLTRRGVLVQEMGQTYLAEPDAEGEEARTRRPLQAAAITSQIAFGPRAGHKVQTLRAAMPREDWARQPLCTDIDGFSLHAAVRVEAHGHLAANGPASSSTMTSGRYCCPNARRPASRLAAQNRRCPSTRHPVWVCSVRDLDGMTGSCRSSTPVDGRDCDFEGAP
jgi:hypothetical protein